MSRKYHEAHASAALAAQRRRTFVLSMKGELDARQGYPFLRKVRHKDGITALVQSRNTATNRTPVANRKTRRQGGPTLCVTLVKRRPKKHVVYFIQASCGPIKIGTTGDIEYRLAILRGQSPVQVELLATVPGKRVEEFEYHRRFAAHRLHGEWFEPHPDILAEIARLSTPTRAGRTGR